MELHSFRTIRLLVCFFSLPLRLPHDLRSDATIFLCCVQLWGVIRTKSAACQTPPRHCRRRRRCRAREIRPFTDPRYLIATIHCGNHPLAYCPKLHLTAPTGHQLIANAVCLTTFRCVFTTAAKQPTRDFIRHAVAVLIPRQILPSPAGHLASVHFSTLPPRFIHCIH
jgi:hypothetical protein